jgi:mono/diheme cytochrome c family protein
MTKAKLATLGLLPLAFAFTGCTHEVSFKNDVHPILEAHCASCHKPGGEGYAKSGFSVESYQTLMKGTKFGPVIIAGSSVGSTLTRLIEHQASPSIAMPKSLHPGMPAESLTKEQIDTIEKWIDQGAKDN